MTKRSRRRARYRQAQSASPQTTFNQGPSWGMIVIVILALAALVIGGLQIASPPPATPQATASFSLPAVGTPAPADATPGSSEPGWNVEGEGRRLGPAEASVSMAIWNDLSCRDCRQWSNETLLELLTREIAIDQANLTLYDYIDDDESALAARATWAADQQGSFWNFYLAAHDLDSEGGPGANGPIAFTRDLAIQIASVAELDVQKFIADFDSAAADEAMTTARAASDAAEIEEVPLVIVGSQYLVSPEVEEVSEAMRPLLSSPSVEPTSAASATP